MNSQQGRVPNTQSVWRSTLQWIYGSFLFPWAEVGGKPFPSMRRETGGIAPCTRQYCDRIVQVLLYLLLPLPFSPAINVKVLGFHGIISIYFDSKVRGIQLPKSSRWFSDAKPENYPTDFPWVRQLLSCNYLIHILLALIAPLANALSCHGEVQIPLAHLVPLVPHPLRFLRWFRRFLAFAGVCFTSRPPLLLVCEGNAMEENSYAKMVNQPRK